jgi:hypothetical protein
MQIKLDFKFLLKACSKLLYGMNALVLLKICANGRMKKHQTSNVQRDVNQQEKD